MATTFVAFVDISGFKEMMKGGDKQASNALKAFYQTGYNALNAQREVVNGLFSF